MKRIRQTVEVGALQECAARKRRKPMVNASKVACLKREKARLERAIIEQSVEVLLPQPPEATIQVHFVDCLRTGWTPDTFAECGLPEMKVLDAIYASSEQRREINVV